MSPTHDPTEHEDEREDRAREVHPLTKAFRALGLERRRRDATEEVLEEVHGSPPGIPMPKGTTCVMKEVAPTSTLKLSYAVWLVLQPTHVQEEILGVDRAHELREAYEKLREIAFGGLVGADLEGGEVTRRCEFTGEAPPEIASRYAPHRFELDANAPDADEALCLRCGFLLDHAVHSR